MHYTLYLHINLGRCNWLRCRGGGSFFVLVIWHRRHRQQSCAAAAYENGAAAPLPIDYTTAKLVHQSSSHRCTHIRSSEDWTVDLSTYGRMQLFTYLLLPMSTKTKWRMIKYLRYCYVHDEYMRHFLSNNSCERLARPEVNSEYIFEQHLARPFQRCIICWNRIMLSLLGGDLRFCQSGVSVRVRVMERALIK